MSSVLVTLVVVLCGGLVFAAEDGRAFARDCNKDYSVTCLKLDVVSFVERLSESDDYGLVPGVSLVKDKTSESSRTSNLVAELARDFPNDAGARLDAFLLKKVEGFMNTHSIRLRLLDPKGIEAARTMAEAVTGRGKGGKKGMGAALMAAAMMMKGTLLSIGMGALALLAGKALMTGLLALMLSAIIGLKALTSGGHKSTTYEIVSKPVYTSSHSHSSSHEDAHGSGYGGYGHGRSLQNVEIPDGFPKQLLKS